MSNFSFSCLTTGNQNFKIESMFKNYFKTAWRNLVKNKVYSALNILGLATGMAVALIIGLWVYYQYSYDRFLPGYENVYQVYYRTTGNDSIYTQNSVAYPLADVLKKDIPGIKYVAQTDWISSHGLVAGEKKLYENGAMAGSDFLKIFQYDLIKGSAENVLKDPYSIVLTESIAKALFGNEDPINKVVRIDNTNNLKVSGILKDIPKNSTFQFKYLVPFDYFMSNGGYGKQWGNNSYQTFVALQPNVSYAEIDPKIKYLLKKYDAADYAVSKGEVFMYPLASKHLYSDFKNGIPAGGLIDYVKMFSIIGLLVLLIACINFMNLSTARSEKRAREVGVRKAVGSQRANLIFQFLIESLVITFAAFILSLLLLQLMLPAFNSLTQANISIPYNNIFFWCLMTGYVLITGLLAGCRPAFYLSSFNAVKVLKGAIITGGKASWPRKILVTLQFTSSVALIISTIVIYQQIQYARNRPVGYDANRLMMTDVSPDLQKNYEVLKNDMLQSGLVTGVTKASCPVTELWSWNDINNWPGKRADEQLFAGTVALSDADYFKTLGMRIIEGRNFIGDVGADSLNMIINEAAAKRMRLNDPVGQKIDWGQTAQPATIIGVVDDALMSSPFSDHAPTYFMYHPAYGSSIMYRLSPSVNTREAVAKLTTIFNKYNPAYPYLYKFVDESYAAKFQLETLIGKLAALFATLAIFISCLGLFGLAAYMAEQRFKEIGIRKVLGASAPQVWLLLSKEFIVLVLISCIVASPVAYYYLSNWLVQYSYRISIQPFVFVISGFTAMILTAITISFQAIRAAVSNPVKSLRTE
jgi:ABC-type antimicrobial peptide transport system permease subunit